MEILIGWEEPEQCVLYIPNIVEISFLKAIAPKLNIILLHILPNIFAVILCGPMENPEDIGNFGKIKMYQYSSPPSLVRDGNTKSSVAFHDIRIVRILKLRIVYYLRGCPKNGFPNLINCNIQNVIYKMYNGYKRTQI